MKKLKCKKKYIEGGPFDTKPKQGVKNPNHYSDQWPSQEAYNTYRNTLNLIGFNPNDYPLDLSDVPEPSISGQDNTELIKQISQAGNTNNYDFTKNPLIDNPSNSNTNTTAKTKSYSYNPYIGLVNVFDFGLNSLANFKKKQYQEEQDKFNQFDMQQPKTSYFNKRQLRGDQSMFAKMGGEYKEGGEFEVDEKELEYLKAQGYEFDIL